MTNAERKAVRLARGRLYIARHNAGETNAAIGRSEGISRERVAQVMEAAGHTRMRRGGQTSTDEQHAVVLGALAAGATNGQAARKAGVTINVVAGLRHRRAPQWAAA